MGRSEELIELHAADRVGDYVFLLVVVHLGDSENRTTNCDRDQRGLRTFAFRKRLVCSERG
jgi:hypothetical protein